MSAFWIGAFGGALAAPVVAVAIYAWLANRSDRGLRTGPLPVLPPPPSPLPEGEATQPLPVVADTITAGRRSHRATWRPLARSGQAPRQH